MLQPLCNFYYRSNNDKLQGACKDCDKIKAKKWHEAKNKEKSRCSKNRSQNRIYASRKHDPDFKLANRLRKYALSKEQYTQMCVTQNHLCAICRKKKVAHIDHCHKTGRVRGLLCVGCNLGIGKLLESPTVLRRAADYIEGQ